MIKARVPYLCNCGMHVFKYIYIYMCIRIYIHAYTCIYMDTYIVHTCTYIHTSIYTYIHACMHMCTFQILVRWIILLQISELNFNYVVYILSLGTLVPNNRDRQGKLWLPKKQKTALKTTLQ